jgi:hypothetical protein
MQRRARRQQLGPHYLSFLTVVLQSEGRQLCAQQEFPEDRLAQAARARVDEQAQPIAIEVEGRRRPPRRATDSTACSSAKWLPPPMVPSARSDGLSGKP